MARGATSAHTLIVTESGIVLALSRAESYDGPMGNITSEREPTCHSILPMRPRSARGSERWKEREREIERESEKERERERTNGCPCRRPRRTRASLRCFSGSPEWVAHAALGCPPHGDWRFNDKPCPDPRRIQHPKPEDFCALRSLLGFP